MDHGDVNAIRDRRAIDLNIENFEIGNTEDVTVTYTRCISSSARRYAITSTF